MEIESIRMQNFKVFEDETVHFDDLNIFIGPNGVGKSSILSALNLFFEVDDHSISDIKNLEENDFHFGNTSKPIKITITFKNLTPEEEKDFSTYFRQGKLIVSAMAEFNERSRLAPIKRRGSRLGIEDFREFFEKDKVGDKKIVYQKLLKKFPDLPPSGTGPAMTQSLHDFEKNNPELCNEILSSDLFDGWSKGNHKFKKYIQWIFIPAVKDATNEQIEAKNTALSKLIDRIVVSKNDMQERIEILKEKTIRSYEEILGENNESLEIISKKITQSLQNWSSGNSSVNLTWQNEKDKSIKVEFPRAGVSTKEGAFEGELFKFGHGLQRSFLMALLQTLSELNDENSPKLILGCEEPELFQHPPQIRYLSETFEEIANKGSQIIYATHSPILVTGKSFHNIKMVKKDSNDRGKINQLNIEDINNEIKNLNGNDKLSEIGQTARWHQVLIPSLSEMFFAKHVTLVEGREDYCYIVAYLKLSGLWGTFNKLGCHIVPVDGKNNILQPLIIGTKLGLPVYPIWDCDNKEEDTNLALFKFFGKNNNKIEEDIINTDFTAWKKNIGEVFKDDIGEKNIESAYLKVQRKFNISEKGMSKNILIRGYLIEELWNGGFKSQSLLDLCDNILTHAKTYT